MKPILLIVAAALAGCAAPQPPTNPSNPSANFAADRWACQQAVAALPPLATPTAPQSRGTTTTYRADGIGGVVATTTPSGATGVASVDAMHATMAQLAAQRAQNEREGAWRNCMMAKGWQ